MKRFFALALALLLCLALAACGSGGSSIIDTPEKLAGTYRAPEIFDTTYVFNANGSFDAVSESISEYNNMGTFNFGDEGGLSVYAKSNLSFSTPLYQFKQKDGYFYRTDKTMSWFGKDNDYGLQLTLDENGRTEQSFTAGRFTYDNNATHSFHLFLNSDGTCSVVFLITANNGMGDDLHKAVYDGTYEVKDDILTLSYNNTTHPMLIIDNVIYFYVLERQE